MIKALAVVVLAAVAAGAFFWFSRSPETSPVPLAQVQGTSFDVAPQPKPVEAKPVEPFDAAQGKPATPKVEVSPVVVAPSVEIKPPAPEPKPAPAALEVKPEPKPVVVAAPEAKPEPKPVVEANPAPAPPPAEAKPPSAPAPGGASEGKPPVDDKPMLMTFAKLAFRYWPPLKDKGARDPFPKEIRALNGRKVVMDGFMFPIDFEKGKVRSFILSNGMFGCCFGDAPQITETIKVYRSDGKLMPYQSMARVTGLLEVGEEFDADGYVDSVYRIKADDVGSAQIEHK